MTTPLFDLFADVSGSIAGQVPRHSMIGAQVEVCYQRQIREKWMTEQPMKQLSDLSGCRVMEITPTQAKPIILKYEWLGTMGRSVHCCGLISPTGVLLGAACFGWPASPESRDICGKHYRKLAICLERGACVHYAPPNAASFLVRHACRLVAKKYGYRIFYAYADEDAGEIGTIYQACNWIYIGQGVGRTPGRTREYFKDPSGRVVASRTLRHRGLLKSEIIKQGWTVVHQRPKHKYIWFEAGSTERKKLWAALRYPPAPYPKRK